MAKLRNTKPRRSIVRAIHPNAGVEAWFQSELDALLQASIRDAILEVGRAYTQDPPTVGIAMDVAIARIQTGIFLNDDVQYEMAMDAPSSTKKIDKALKTWGDKWATKFDKLSVKLSERFTTRAFSATDTSMRAALKDAGFTVAFKPSRAMLEAYRLVVADNVGLIRNLHASLYNKIQQDTWASVRAGSDLATLATKLQYSYGIEKKRAALIARDQNAKAKAVLETTRRKQLGLKKAIWQHSSAGKTPRPTHVAMNGKEYDLDQGMYDDDEGRYVFPGELVNCRCTSRAVIPGFEEE